METSFNERRRFERISLRAYGQGKSCLLERGGKAYKAELIDISAGGARIRLASDSGPAGKDVVFSVLNVQDKGLLQKLPAAVRWQNGAECGLQFAQDLGVAVGTLQRIVC